MPRQTPARRWLAAVTITIIVSLTLLACQSGSTPAVEEVTPVGAQNANASTTSRSGGTTVAGRSVTSSAAEVGTSEGTPVPGATNVSVSPGEVAQGNVLLSLSVMPAQPMYDAAKATSATTSDDQKPNSQPKGYAVLGGSTLKVTNNFDGAQGAPADQPREMVRHVALQIKDKDSGQLIPHVVVSVDLLRDGRPVLQDQALVPMVQVGGGVTQMQYGNNVKFPGRGEYQVFIRLDPSPFLASGAAGVAQFNVSIK